MTKTHNHRSDSFSGHRFEIVQYELPINKRQTHTQFVNFQLRMQNSQFLLNRKVTWPQSIYCLLFISTHHSLECSGIKIGVLKSRPLVLAEWRGPRKTVPLGGKESRRDHSKSQYILSQSPLGPHSFVSALKAFVLLRLSLTFSRIKLYASTNSRSDTSSIYEPYSIYINKVGRLNALYVLVYINLSVDNSLCLKL